MIQASGTEGLMVPVQGSMDVEQHSVAFEEAVTVLVSPLGFSARARVLFVVTSETTTSGRTRIISARKATKHEAKRLGE